MEEDGGTQPSRTRGRPPYDKMQTFLEIRLKDASGRMFSKCTIGAAKVLAPVARKLPLIL
jgi:hypothetical protein